MTAGYHERPRLFLASETFRRHMTDEGWQLQKGLEHAGYELWGRYLPNDETDVRRIVSERQPSVVVVQDKREWDPAKLGCYDKTIGFLHSDYLASLEDVFRVTILKDAHQDPAYHRAAADEIGAHAWIVYYHPDTVCRLAPWVRREDLIRTYHSVDADVIPPYSANRNRAVLSGYLAQSCYPLRTRIADARLPMVTVLPHPGYHAKGAATPGYLETLSGFKVAIATCSIYGYALRKIVEGVACGCTVVTDLSETDKLPVIDKALVRVSPAASASEVAEIVSREIADYDPEYRQEIAEKAKVYYDYRAVGQRLANKIDKARR